MRSALDVVAQRFVAEGLPSARKAIGTRMHERANMHAASAKCAP